MNDNYNQNPQNRSDRVEIPEGRHLAAYVTHDVGMAETNTVQIGVLFEFVDPPLRGQQITWYGTFTEAAFPITFRALKELGWSGHRIDTLKAELKRGTVVQLVIERESFQGRTRPRVKFINARGVIRMAKPMNRDQKLAFASEVQTMLDLGLQNKQPAGTASAAPGDDAGGEDDIPF